MWQLCLIIFVLFSNNSEALIGYDCGSTVPNITTFSLLDSGECNFQESKVNSTNVAIELLQVADFRSIPIIQCKIEIHRTVFDCGMFGHLIPTEHAEQEYIKEISHEQCKFIHETGIFKYDNMHTISDLKINATTTKGIDFAGSAAGRSCSGAFYADSFGSWNNVFVNGLIKITLTQNFARVNLNNDRLTLISGITCRFSEKACMDMEGGNTFWNVLPENQCFKNSFDVLFKGVATKYVSNNNKEIVYSVNARETTFALAIKNKELLCNRELIRTEHPKLYIAEKDSNLNSYYYDIDAVNGQNVNSINLDLFTYINSKFVYIERHIRNQVNDLYINLVTEKCELERKVIQNSLSIASLSPDEFAYNIMKQPGYFAKIAGEVVHLIKCVPRTVKILQLQNCYNQLPVSVGNETWFLTPKTHILVKKGMQVDCNSIIPTYYKIDDEWIKFTPLPTKTISPHLLHPNKELGWTFKSIENLATSGVYSQTELDKLQQQLMFPMEKTALLNVIAREMAGEATDGSIFSENTLQHIADNTWKKIFEKLTTWGSVSSAIFMIFIFLHIGKLLIDTIIRGYALHAVYGWSMRMFGAVFGSITHLFTTLEKARDKKEQKIHDERVNLWRNNRKNERDTDMELNEIKIISAKDEKLSISNPISKPKPSMNSPPPIPNRPPNSDFCNIHKTKSIFSLSLE